MTTGTKIIQKSLQRIGKHSVVKPAASEVIEDGMDHLNSMIQGWESLCISMGCMPLKVPGDELSEPSDVKNAIIDNLAIYMAPSMNGRVTPELTRAANNGLALIKDLYQDLTIPNKVVSSTLPLGEGNDNLIGSQTFAGDGYELSDA